MNILLLTNVVFILWQNVLLEWERCNILDGSKDVPIYPSKLIRKLLIVCRTLRKNNLRSWPGGSFKKTITLREFPAKGGEA
jgi:hypothetical protein